MVYDAVVIATQFVVPLLMYKRVEVEEPPVLMHKSPFVAEKAGASLVTQTLMFVENIEIAGPAATAPAEAGTAADLTERPPALTTPIVVAVAVTVSTPLTVVVSLVASPKMVLPVVVRFVGENVPPTIEPAVMVPVVV